MADNDRIRGAERKGGEKTETPHWEDFYQEIGHKVGIGNGTEIEPRKK